MYLLLLFLGGLVIGIFGVLFGASAFLALPFVQVLYPQFSFTQVLGNARVGFLSRGLASTGSTWKHIDVKAALGILIPFSLASIVGLLLTVDLDRSYLLYAVLIAIVVSELGPKVAPLMNKKTRFIFSILLGLYQGMINAGISVMLLGLVRTFYPKDEDIVTAKIQSLFIETSGLVMLVLIHIFTGDLTFPVWLVFGAGSAIGGYIAGHFLKKSIKLSPKTQRAYVLVVYVIALLPFLFL